MKAVFCFYREYNIALFNFYNSFRLSANSWKILFLKCNKVLFQVS